jgi:hypothetical protein
MKAFHNDKQVKSKYLKRVEAHRKADNIIQGQGWSEGKGCAIGCTLENYDHQQYEIELGIPEWLARVEDTIFEGLPKDIAMKWPGRFLKAVNVGVDLNKVKTPFLIFVLEQNLLSMEALKFDAAAFPDVAKAVQMSKDVTVEIIRCHRLDLDLSAARSAARSAAESAAESAAWSARSAAWSAAESAAESARSAAYVKYADKLIELIKQVK